MEASRNDELLNKFEKTKSFISAWFGVILTVLAMIVIFIVASLEGSRQIQASNSDSGMLLSQWRQETGQQEGFPEEYITVIEHDNRDYYFVIDERHFETGEILSWYWAYDGGIDYVFRDYRHYVLVSITFVFSIFVSLVNYNSTIEKATQTENFKKTLLYYKKRKDEVRGHTQYLPYFCKYKNQDAYQTEKQNIVESADLNFEDYLDDKINLNELEKWQRKRLKKIKKIKIKKLKANELLYETKYDGREVRLLPQSQEEHRKSFIYKGSVTKFITSFMSGLVAGFGIILGNWVLGLVFAFAIVLSAIGAIISAADYATNTLKNRYIGKAEMLLEFDNTKHYYEEQHKELKRKRQAKSEAKLLEESIEREKKLEKQSFDSKEEEEKRSIELGNAV